MRLKSVLYVLGKILFAVKVYNRLAVCNIVKIKVICNFKIFKQFRKR